MVSSPVAATNTPNSATATVKEVAQPVQSSTPAADNSKSSKKGKRNDSLPRETQPEVTTTRGGNNANTNNKGNNKGQPQSQPQNQKTQQQAQAPALSKKERKQQKKEQLQEEEKKKQQEEEGWTLVDKKAKKTGGSGKEEIKKAKQQLHAYLDEF